MGLRGAPNLITPARIGTFIVAIGVGGGIASTAGTPTAQADSVVDKLTPNVGVSVGGLGYNSGTARATTAGPNLAIAIGRNATAEAGSGFGNSAVVVGNRSSGTATNGNFNRVRINGDDNTGYAGDGDNNVVRVKGNGNTVQAGGGDNNRAMASGDLNQVIAGCGRLKVGGYETCGAGRRSENNTARVEGNRNQAHAGGLVSQVAGFAADFDGSENTVTIIGGDSTAGGIGQHNVVSVTGIHSSVVQRPQQPYSGYDNAHVTIVGDDENVEIDKDGFTYP